MDKKNLEFILQNAKTIAKKAGAILQKYYVEGEFSIENKGTDEEVDIVTQADLESQDLVVSELKTHFPKHVIIAEEAKENPEKSYSKGTEIWYIDPLDGTNNFSKGYPKFCVSMAYGINDDIKVGVVYDPVLDELFYATEGGGAFLNGQRICVSSEARMSHSFVATGFPYTIKDGSDDSRKALEQFIAMQLSAARVLRDGSAALNLCYVGMGRFDGFWELGLKSWDIGAGMLIVAEAGGKFTSYDGGDVEIYGKNIIASNGLIHRDIRQVLGSVK